MSRLRKSDALHRADEIKQLILSGQPFAEPLARLYTQLRLQASYAWMVDIYQWLSLYTLPQARHILHHPALLQAYMALGKTAAAQNLAQQLVVQMPQDPEVQKLVASLQSRTDSVLPAYTPLASLSRYAAPAMRKSRPTPHTLPAGWAETLQQITPEKLEEIGYYRKIKQLAKIHKQYRPLVLKTFDELVLNFLFQQERSVMVLAGALLEILLAVDLYHTRHIRRIVLQKQRKQVFDLTLHELVGVYSKEQWLPPQVLRLCRATRVQRNFIHPGKELQEHTHLSAAGAHVCFCAVLEVIDALF